MADGSDDKTYHVIAGMPRSGSTLLCNILAQNPRFEVTATSEILGVIFNVRDAWVQAIGSACSAERQMGILRGVLRHHYQRRSKPVIFDKCRGWLAAMETLEAILGRKAKVLVPVRDVRDVLASFEKIWRRNVATSLIPHQRTDPVAFEGMEGRCATWMRPQDIVGLAYARIEDALARGYRDRMHFVRFDRLTSEPEATLRGIYAFLDEPCFAHNFDAVEQVTWEDDMVHGMKGLHDIRAKVEAMPPQWPHILGDVAGKYSGPYVWDLPQWK